MWHIHNIDSNDEQDEGKLNRIKVMYYKAESHQAMKLQVVLKNPLKFQVVRIR